MREVKFRARHKKTKSWWCGGGVVTVKDKCAMLSLDDNKNAIIHIVDPETVGQFTGLCDKNGKEICEGDLALHPINNEVAIVKDKPYEVKYLTDQGKWILDNVYTFGQLQLYLQTAIVCEIIGNIYDNPELLNDH